MANTLASTLLALLIAGLGLHAPPASSQPAELQPRPPRTFDISRFADGIALEWTTHPGIPDPVAWEIYRTSDYADNLPYTLIQTLPGSARSFTDADYIINTAYFYYIVAVGEPTPVDPSGINGTPRGSPLRSGRYFAQTNILTAVGFRPGLDRDSLSQNAPNPFTHETTMRYIANGPAFVRLSVYNVLGQEVAVLFDDYVESFVSADARWTGIDHTGKKVPSGIYFCRLTVGPFFRKTIPMVFLR